MSLRTLLPSEISSRIPDPQSRSDEPELFLQPIAECLRGRHPDLLALDVDAYKVPLATALFLYRRDPNVHRMLVASALGSGMAADFPLVLAAAARDAWQAQDWKLLGNLAFRLDVATTNTRWPNWRVLMEEVSLDGAPQHHCSSDGLQKLQSAFHKAFGFEQGLITAEHYVRVALGYFAALPVNFIPPPGLLVGTSEWASESWSLLTLFCTRNALPWQTVAGAFESLRKLEHPFLAGVGERLAQPAQTPPPRLRRMQNPFAAIAGDLAIEPRRRRPRRNVAPSPQLPEPSQDPFVGAEQPEPRAVAERPQVTAPTPAPRPCSQRSKRGRGLFDIMRSAFRRKS